MKIVKGIFSKLIYTILIILVVFNVYNYVCIKVLKQDLPTINGYGVLEVISGSMEPTIDIGDLVIINTNFDELKENDIITFYDARGNFVTHRIIEIVNNEFVTKGDNNNSKDQGRITKNEVVGIYVKRIKGLGKLMAGFKNPITMVMILVIGVLICFLVSTDKEGNLVVTDEEKEYEEFLKYKKSLNQNNNENVDKEEDTSLKNNKVKETKKSISSTKLSTKNTTDKTQTKTTTGKNASKVKSTKTTTTKKTSKEK